MSELTVTTQAAPGLAVGSIDRVVLTPPILAERYSVRTTLRDVLVAAFYYKRALLIAFLLPFAIGLYAAVMSQKVFVADERLLVLLGSEYVYRPEVGDAGSGNTLDRNQIMQGELEILQSEPLRVATLRKLGLGNVYPDLDAKAKQPPSMLQELMAKIHGRTASETADAAAATLVNDARSDAELQSIGADRLRRNLTITAVPQTNVIQMSFRHNDGVIAAEVLNTFVALYLDRRDQVFSRPHTEASDQQYMEYGQRLRTAEDALSTFSDQHHIASFDEQMSRLLDQQTTATSEQAKNSQLIASLQAQVAVLQAQVAQVPEFIQLFTDTERAPTATASADEYVRLQTERRLLASRYQPGSPQLKEADQRLAHAKADSVQSRQLEAKGVRTGQNPAWLAAKTHLDQVSVDLQGALGQHDQIKKSVDTINQQIRDLSDAGTQYRDLRRTRDVLADTYRVYSHNREEARLSDTLDRGRLSNIRIVQAAFAPATGSAQRALLLGGGIALGLLLALAVLIVLNSLRQIMLSVEEVERALQLPVIVAVSRADPLNESGMVRGGTAAQSAAAAHANKVPA